jgi:hypothetical protein
MHRPSSFKDAGTSRNGRGAQCPQLDEGRPSVTATMDREVRNLDERALSWGLEKALSTSTLRLGTATQTFTLEIAPR